jgi:hypothetical protein
MVILLVTCPIRLLMFFSGIPASRDSCADGGDSTTGNLAARAKR